MVQLFEMLFNAIKIYTIPLFPGHFKMCQKEYKHTLPHTHTAFGVALRVRSSLFLTLYRTYVFECVLYCIWKMWIFINNLCVHIFSVRVDGGASLDVCACPRDHDFILYVVHTGLVCDDVMMAFFGAECGVCGGKSEPHDSHRWRHLERVYWTPIKQRSICYQW